MAVRFGENDWFFHIPRTGGHFIKRALKRLYKDGAPVPYADIRPKHGTPDEIDPAAPARSFCVIRPPIDWYRSFYRYRIMKHVVELDLDGDSGPHLPLDKYLWRGQYSKGGQVNNFRDFIIGMYSEFQCGYATDLYNRYTPHVSHVLITSDLSIDLPMLLAAWGYDTPTFIPAQKTNVTTTPRKNHFAPRRRYKALARIDQGTLPGLPVPARGIRYLIRHETQGVWDWDIRKGVTW